MNGFNHFDVAEMLGSTPLCKITDEELWARIVSPMTKGLLGPIIRVDKPTFVETVAGSFAGDEVSNLNDHRLYGGQAGYIRFPYIRTFYKTQHGAFIVKRDGGKVQVLCWQGDVEKGKAELMLKVSARDRRFDGTKRANDTALLDWRYDDPVLHKLLSPELRSAELSVYSFLPGSSIVDTIGDAEYHEFVRHPMKFVSKPQCFIKYFNRAWKAKRSPGQHSAPIKDVSEQILRELEQMLLAVGYDVVEVVPSHYHVARWFMAAGYAFNDAAHADNFAQLMAGLEQIRKNGLPLTRPQQSWVCVIQSLRPVELIPNGLFMNGPVWQQTNLNDFCLWMHKPLSEKAKTMLAKPA